MASTPGPALRRLALLASLALAACASPEEIREAQLAHDRVACEDVGLEPGSESFTLCLLLQDTNRRLDHIGQRVYLMESDLRRLELLDRPFLRRW